MPKYDPLHTFLTMQTGSTVSLTFAQIERLIGGSLPPSARTHRQWWANQVDARGRVQARAWMEAGWNVTDVSFDREVVTFRRTPHV